jgi:hypothetical protein
MILGIVVSTAGEHNIFEAAALLMGEQGSASADFITVHLISIKCTIPFVI